MPPVDQIPFSVSPCNRIAARGKPPPHPGSNLFRKSNTGAIVTRRFLLFLLTFLTLTCVAQAAYQPGFKTVGIWNPAKNARLDLAVWYPSTSSSFQVDYGDWSFSAARGRPPVEGMHPLILLSHDSAGSRFSLHQLAGTLARNGFVAVALTHPGDNIDDMQTLFTPEQATARAKQLTQTIDIVLSDPETATLIDPDRIGVLGVGPGGTAALLLAGARLDPIGWTGYCNGKQDSADPYCAPWAKQRMDTTVGASPQKPITYRDRRIRVAAAVAPAYPMLFTRPSLSRIRIPLLLVRAERDQLYTLQHAERLLGSFPQPPQLVMLPDADAATLMSPCGGNLLQTIPEMCQVDPSRRNAVQEKMATDSVAFFLKYLGSPNPPPLPPEPEDEPTITSPPPVPEKAARKKQK